MLNKNVRIRIKNGVSQIQLLNALLKARSGGENEILTISVLENDVLIFTEFNGIRITQWYVKDVFKFIDNVAEKGYDDSIKILTIL